ncbi:hypothetical protein NQ318_016609 [Aromia moschata]|uniref:Uncharacterized protein n=1 Tax=Aromia moschata TaxID=1265417 RepID=A0AAV8X409_9CUCU|nr:hypothetical protein NQ318_016609 [Aromia moschata]
MNVYPAQKFLNGLNGLQRDVKRSKTICTSDGPQQSVKNFDITSKNAFKMPEKSQTSYVRLRILSISPWCKVLALGYSKKYSNQLRIVEGGGVCVSDKNDIAYVPDVLDPSERAAVNTVRWNITTIRKSSAADSPLRLPTGCLRTLWESYWIT